MKNKNISIRSPVNNELKKKKDNEITDEKTNIEKYKKINEDSQKDQEAK